MKSSVPPLISGHIGCACLNTFWYPVLRHSTSLTDLVTFRHWTRVYRSVYWLILRDEYEPFSITSSLLRADHLTWHIHTRLTSSSLFKGFLDVVTFYITQSACHKSPLMQQTFATQIQLILQRFILRVEDYWRVWVSIDTERFILRVTDM